MIFVLAFFAFLISVGRMEISYLTYIFAINISLYYRKLAHICRIKSNKICSEQIWFISASREGRE